MGALPINRFTYIHTEKYGNVESAKKTITDTQAILDRFDKEVAPMILGNDFCHLYCVLSKLL